jgi:hypothetical protein
VGAPGEGYLRLRDIDRKFAASIPSNPDMEMTHRNESFFLDARFMALGAFFGTGCIGTVTERLWRRVQ